MSAWNQIKTVLVKVGDALFPSMEKLDNRRREAYLSQSKDIAELESKMRSLQRHDQHNSHSLY